MTTPPHEDDVDIVVAAIYGTGLPPICSECELPMEEVTHGYVFEWACVRDICASHFRATFEEFTDPELLIILGRPECYRCHQRRDMMRVGDIVRFECPNPGCDEFLRLISSATAKVVKARAAAATACARGPRRWRPSAQHDGRPSIGRGTGAPSPS